MLGTEKQEFGSIMSKLCAVFDRKVDAELISSYWAALQAMPLIGFQRAADKAIETSERMPRPSQIWTLYRDSKRAATGHQAVQDRREEQLDAFEAFGNRALLVFLLNVGAASTESLKQLVAEKNRVVGNFRLISTEDVVTAEEMREALMKAFKRVWRAMPEGELLSLRAPK